MQTQWFSHLPKPEQENFKRAVLSSEKVLDRAREIVYNMIKVESLADYDSPSWAFKQADLNGYNRALRDVAALLNISDHEKR